MTLSEAEFDLLDRIDRGKQIFRVKLRTREALKEFDEEVERLLSFRDRGWIRLEDRHISRTASGQYLAVGPCELTPAGREALDRDRRLGPRGHESD